MSKAWYDDNEQLELFYSEVAEEMVAKRYLRAMPDSAIDNDACRACVADFREEVAPIQNFETRDECLQAFMGWMRGTVVQPLEKGQRIYAEITRSFGDVTMTFGYGAGFAVQTNGQIRAAFAYCVDQVERQFEANVTGVMLKSRTVQQQPAAPDETTFMGDEIVVESKSGKLYYKIVGGPYSKYGIRVWPEVLEEFGVKVDQLKGGKSYKLARWCHVALKPDGKPEKVIKISNA